MKSTDWDKRYSEGNTPWDHGFASPAIDEVIAEGVFAPHSEVLVPGCGRGHDVRAFAAAGFVATGLDLSEVVIQECQSVKGGEIGKGGETTYFQGDLLDPNLPNQKRYDVIWEHTCFCALSLNLRSSYAEAVHGLLNPGGYFVGVFFMDTGNPPGEGPPFSVDQEELHQLFGVHFSLRWEHKPQRTYKSRIDREWLMCWQRNR